MFANERYLKILDLLDKESSVTVSELMKLFGVSIETVRRDLEHLEKQELLTRVHGGAISNKKMNKFEKLESRMSENRALKQQLAKIAVRYIRENDTIAIDSGSTAMELVPFIKSQFRHLTIVTNSPEVFNAFSDMDRYELIQIGGQYLRDEKAFYGHLALDAVNRLHFSKAFIFPSAISLRYGVGVFVHELFDIERAFMHNADEVFILADHSKYEKTATIKLCDVSTSYKFITDSEMPDQVYERYRKHSIQIINK